MSVVLYTLGASLVLLALVDALWTTLWSVGKAGPLTARLTSLVWLAGRAAATRGRHRLASLTGPAVVVAVGAAWLALLWAGWTLVFGADPGAVRPASGDEPVGWVDRAWFTGYTVFTLGNGDFVPAAGAWQLLSVLATVSGLALATLAVTYTLNVISADVQKRSFASQVSGLGATPEELVVAAWNGSGFGGFETKLDRLAANLGTVTEQHAAYPILHYYHSAEAARSPLVAVAVLDDALSLLEHGVREDARPAPWALRSARSAVGGFLEVLGAGCSAAAIPPPAPSLGRLRRAGVATVSDEQFARALERLADRRRTLLAAVQREGRDWPAQEEER